MSNFFAKKSVRIVQMLNINVYLCIACGKRVLCFFLHGKSVVRVSKAEKFYQKILKLQKNFKTG